MSQVYAHYELWEDYQNGMYCGTISRDEIQIDNAKREEGFLPVVVIEKDLSNRMASTIRHNRARGVHSIELMSNIVSDLVTAGMSDGWILRHIGMDKDEDVDFNQAWNMDVKQDTVSESEKEFFEYMDEHLKDS